MAPEGPQRASGYSYLRTHALSPNLEPFLHLLTALGSVDNFLMSVWHVSSVWHTRCHPRSAF